MLSTAAVKKLDLSKLTDDEAKHVWDVVQRDFDLRKKEEDRLGDLKTKIEKEDTKRELLGHQTRLAESYCLHCLQPFKFLVNSKRQCLDCRLYVCKACSRYNKKERGSVCDPCHMARVLKIGTLEWYHANVRARFKRFGSAKVMRSLFKRLSGKNSCSQSEHGDLYEDHGVDSTDSQHYKRKKKAKRRLTVDPIDFELGFDHPEWRGSDQAPGAHDIMVMEVSERESMLTEADMASVFTQQTEDRVYRDPPAPPSRSVSRLSQSSCGSAGTPRAGSGSFLPRSGDSDSDRDELCQRYLLYHSHLGACSHTSQESLNSANPPPQIADMDRHISDIETFLNRLEQKVSLTYDEASVQAPSTPGGSSTPPQWEAVDLEEQQLRQKLRDMTNDISDHSLSSDEEPRPHSSQEVPARRSPEWGEPRPSRIPTRPPSRLSMVDFRPSAEAAEEPPQQNHTQKTLLLPSSADRKCLPADDAPQSGFRGSTALLVKLEDQVAQAAANVQSARSEVSYIEDRIAALNVAGMPGEKRRRSAIPVQPRRMSHNFLTPTKTGYDPRLMRRRLSLL